MIPKNYSEINPHLFYELKDLMKESHDCIEHKFYTASITLNNHILEKLLKLSLIYKLGLKSDGETFKKLNLEYDNRDMFKNVFELYDLKVLDEDEKDFLIGTVKQVFRNGFSHSETEKILRDVNPEIEVTDFCGNVSKISRHEYRFIGEIQAKKLAEVHALSYYAYLFELIHKLEDKISPETIYLRNLK
jgi:hypothetical protein